MEPPGDSEEVRALKQTIASLEKRVSESRRAERRLAVRDAITRALAESSSLAQAAPCILQAVCETLEWQMGALWTIEPHTQLLHCVEFWHAPGHAAPEFEAATRGHTFTREMGLPGRVWANNQTVWIPDFSLNERFPHAPRAPMATRAGLRAGLGFPIAVRNEVLGVLEFFSHTIKEPDTELLEMCRAIGSQIGQFVERKNAEEMLHRFFMLSIDMFAIAGFDGYFKLVNPAWERTLGYTQAEMLAKPFLDFVHPDDRESTLSEVAHLASGEETVSFENRYLAKDGSYRWLMWNSTPMPQQKLIYAAARDITEWKRAQSRIEKLRVEAEEANRAKSEFLARMSHEIRTPLNVVIGMGDLLERTTLDRSQQQYVRVFQKAGNTLLTLINDILDLARVESGRIALEEIDFDLNALLEAAVEIMSVRAEEKGLELSYEIEPGTPRHVRGDPNRLRQVLINLISNAIKFTAQGSVRVTAGLAGSESKLRFSVADTGIGIAADKLEVIFDSFTQADASTTRRYGGTGLGLAICKRLVELLGGRIWVESAPGTGATFHFTMKFSPAANAVEEAQAPVEMEPRATGTASSLRILVVDDSEENRYLVAEYLKDLRCDIEYAVNGEEAVQKFVAGRFDLVLMDLQMPVMDGYEATRRIRQWEQKRQQSPTPVIALTASAMDAELQHSLDVGCTAYVRKPVRLSTLVDTVNRYAGSARKIVVRPDVRLRHLIPSYLASRRRDAEAILQALRESDFEKIREIGHKMSGTGGAFGFPQITGIGQAIEAAAKQKDVELIQSRTAELTLFLEQVVTSDT